MIMTLYSIIIAIIISIIGTMVCVIITLYIFKIIKNIREIKWLEKIL